MVAQCRTRRYASTSGRTGAAARQHQPAAAAPTPLSACPLPARLLPPAIASRLVTNPLTRSRSVPDIAIGCGLSGQAAVLAARRQYRAYAIYIQKPSGSAAQFDSIVAPAHDYRHPPPNAICTLGALGGDIPARGGGDNRFCRYPAPLIGALIGGDNRAYRLPSDSLINQLSCIAARTGGTLLITPSRRSSAALCRRLRQTFAPRHYVWDGSGDNPYHAIRAAAAAFCVTADSVNMVSEACSSGKAVYLLALQEKTRLPRPPRCTQIRRFSRRPAAARQHPLFQRQQRMGIFYRRTVRRNAAGRRNPVATLFAEPQYRPSDITTP